MKHVPYHANPGNACALACYTMAAQYLLPNHNVTFAQLACIADWQKGYVVWGFAVWKWMMDRGVHMTNYDIIDYAAWAAEGVSGLQKSVPAKEFNYYKQNTFDLDAESQRVNLMLTHPHFTYRRRTPNWGDIVREFHKPGICDVTLNRQCLNRQPGFDGHRVVLLDISDDEVVFHDPNRAGTGAYRREAVHHFKLAVASFGSPELARYSLE